MRPELFNEFSKFLGIVLLAFAFTVFDCAPANAQRARFPDFFQVQGQPVGNQSIITSPPTQFTPPPVYLQPPQQVFQNPAFNTPTVDPFQVPNQAFPIFPQPTQIAPQALQNFAPNGGQPIFGQPNQVPPNYQPGFSDQFAVPQYGSPQFGSPQFPGRAPYEGTGSNWLPSINWDCRNRRGSHFKPIFCRDYWNVRAFGKPICTEIAAMN